MDDTGPVQPEFSTLPQEVVDYIVDQLKIDRPKDKTREAAWRQALDTLIACSLVCHRLLPRSSKHALSSIKVLCPPALCKLGGPHAETAIGRLLLHAESSSRLVSNVSTLCLAGRPSEELVNRALQLFTKLINLWFRTENSQLIDAIDLEDEASPVPPPLLGVHHVEYLVFERCYVRSILRFLSLFKHVDRLRFDIVWCIARDLPADVFERLVSARTEHLHADHIFVGTSDTRILRLIGPMLAPRSLRTLSLEDLCGNASRFVELFLKEEACGALERLEVQILSYAWRSTQRNADEKKILDLTPCTQLREVEVTLRDNSRLAADEPISPDFFAFVCSFMLGNLPASVLLVRLHFDPLLPDMTLPSFNPPLRTLATFLDVCTSLQRLEFVGPSSSESNGAQDSIAMNSRLASKFFPQRPYILRTIQHTF